MRSGYNFNQDFGDEYVPVLMEKNVGSREGVILALKPYNSVTNKVLVMIANGCPDSISNPLQIVSINSQPYIPVINSLVSGNTSVYMTIRLSGT